MAERIRSLKDPDVLENFVKKHVKEEPRLTSLLWKSSDMEVVVDSHNEFLVALAQNGYRRMHTALRQALKRQFDTSVPELNVFAKQMSEALSFCRQKRKRVFSGSKTSAGVLKVIRAYGLLRDTTSKPDASFVPNPSSSCAHDADFCTDAEQEQAAKALEQTKAAFSATASSSSSKAPPSKKRQLDDSPVSVKSSEAGEEEKVLHTHACM